MKLLIIVFAVFMLAFGWNSGLTQTTDFSKQVYNSGEELTYKVKWTFIRVGTLRLLNEGPRYYEGKEYFKIQLTLDSAPGVPFITLHDVYECYVDSNSVPATFFAWEKKDDHTIRTIYRFNYEDSLATVSVTKLYPTRQEPVKEMQLPLDDVYRDILSLLYYARQLSAEKQENMVIPTFVLEGKDSCYFNQTGNLQEIDYNDKKADAYYLQGKVKFIGIAGIKDDFEGWFSSDPQRVPLKAKMKAFFGSVTLELEDYKNWQGQP
ncbi:MAG: DUF3108 domain-containing protein [Calditrichia bacterium]